MNLQYKELLPLIEKVGFVNLQRYLQNRRWTKYPSKRENIGIFRNGVDEILLPMDRTFADYTELIYKALQKITIIENRNIHSLINDLLLPPSDVLRFRAANKRTENGLISIREGLELLESAKKSLLSAACDYLSPALYHKRLSNKKANNFIESCLLGQTERGSFVASIVCPFIEPTTSEEQIQLTMFNTEEELAGSFTRSVTRKYMKSLATIKKVIEDGDHSLLETEYLGQDIISANFIDSITELGEYGDNDEIEITSTWSSTTADVDDVPRKISFTKDYIMPMQAIASKLKPHDDGQIGRFVGRVSRLDAEPDIESRSEGDIMFHFLNSEDKVTKARVTLKSEDFERALNAFKEGQNVQISGKLLSKGKSKTIEEPTFQVLI